MKSSSSEVEPPELAALASPRDTEAPAAKGYFCEEPWTGLFSVETSLDVTFCPCYLKLRIGNLGDASIREIWNAEPLIEIRRTFARGELPRCCRDQLCPEARGQGR
jgi:hypothetical protein